LGKGDDEEDPKREVDAEEVEVAKGESPPLPSNKLNSLPDPMMELVLCDSSASSMSSIS
jgi:hypothetical protein